MGGRGRCGAAVGVHAVHLGGVGGAEAVPRPQGGPQTKKNFAPQHVR